MAMIPNRVKETKATTGMTRYPRDSTKEKGKKKI
jgi:hypothetical protein